jgi:O-methyltransferase involved in polyketide biosynthesis
MDLAQAVERRKLFAEVNDSSKRVLVITEGVIGYLSNDEVAALAGDLSERSHFNEWIVDYSSPMLRKALRRRRKVQEHFRNTPLRFNPPDWEAFFRQQGWVVRSMRFFPEEGAGLGRPIPLPWWMRLLTRLSSSQRAQVLRMMGLAVLAQANR